VLDPKIVEALVRPVAGGDLTETEDGLLRMVAEGKPIKAIAAALHTTPAAVDESVHALFLKLAQQASSGESMSLQRLRMLHQAIVEREEQGETLSRLLPGGVAEKLRREGRRIGETERLVVSVLMTDVRGYSGIAETADPSVLAHQLNEHRAAMNRAVIGNGGTVMQFVGDAVLAVFGAPEPCADHADRAVVTAADMHARQDELNEQWRSQELPPFGLGVGISTGEVAAAMLGSDERLEYTVVGDTVNMSQRLQDLARPAGTTVLSDATWHALASPVAAEPMEPVLVKGRAAPVHAYRIPPATAGGQR
jgi:class 3 adenylate cyclase